MKLLRHRGLKVGLAMVIAVGLAWVAKPSESVSQSVSKIDLEAIVPKQFGDWVVDGGIAPVEPPPEVRESLKKIYSQTLSRTYINKSGHRIMLSIAYGNGIDQQLDVHRPEYCYPAQGFEVSAYADQVLSSTFGNLPLRRLVAHQGARVEPISYWVTLGDIAVSSTIGRKLVKLRHGLTGKSGAGMLVRVSSINPDKAAAYGDQDEFIRALLQGMPESQRKQLIGERLSG